MNEQLYSLIGKRARVQLYDRRGALIGALEGRISDIAPQTPVGKDAEGREIKKDLALLVDIERPADAPYQNTAGDRNEGWFAVQDLILLEGNGMLFFSN